MPDTDELGREPAAPEAIFEALARHEVDYLVVGGIAVLVHGYPRLTFDVDIVPSPDAGNLARLAETLVPLLAEDEETAVAMANDALGEFAGRFETAYTTGLRRKLGLLRDGEGDLALGQDLLDRMARNGADFTLVFRRLGDAMVDPERDTAVRNLFSDPTAYDAWALRWRGRLGEDGEATAERRAAAMRAVNPAFIPRNHLVEQALAAAINNDDFSAFDSLVSVLSRPYDDQPAQRHFAEPPRPEEVVRQTFCGT